MTEMQLWTEYEGRTIEGTYTLGKLLRSEGRNGFFATSDTTGHAAVIRLTEAHYDEDALLTRWRQVAGMHQDNLINIARFGQTDFDGIAVTYAIMEANDANLAEVLTERPLTLAETMQVARAVHAALTALHSSGLVHEHIEPVNVLAVGETVKLRSDCVRECIADTEFNTPEGCAELRRRDIHDFGILLLECLTLEKRYNPGLNLPDVFRRLVPHMLDGTWTLEQIGQVLEPAPQPPPNATAQPASAQPATSKSSASIPSQAKPESPEQGRLPLEPVPTTIGAKRQAQPTRSREIPGEPAGFSLRPVLYMCLAVAIVVLLVGWHFLSAKPRSASPAASAPAGTAPAPAPQPIAQPSPKASAAPAPANNAVLHTPGWYVIAYTYNRQAPAQAMAERINTHNRGFHAEILSPHGGAPFLISLGGPMSESEAKALQQRARRSGLPRDTFIRNYR